MICDKLLCFIINCVSYCLSSRVQSERRQETKETKCKLYVTGEMCDECYMFVCHELKLYVCMQVKVTSVVCLCVTS